VVLVRLASLLSRSAKQLPAPRVKPAAVLHPLQILGLEGCFCPVTQNLLDCPSLATLPLNFRREKKCGDMPAHYPRFFIRSYYSAGLMSFEAGVVSRENNCLPKPASEGE